MGCVLIHSMNVQNRCPEKWKRQTLKSSQPIYNYLKGFETLTETEN